LTPQPLASYTTTVPAPTPLQERLHEALEAVAFVALGASLIAGFAQDFLERG
jgi:hypothetical protein